MKKMKFVLPALALLLFACGNRSEVQEPIDFTEMNIQDLSMDSLLADTTLILSSNIPVYFDSTRVLIHPIGFMSLHESKGAFESYKISKRKDYADTSSKFIRISGGTIWGGFTNLIFEDVDKGTGLKPLTDKVVNIESVYYLQSLAKKTNKQYVIYTLQDKDTNRDGKINGLDISSLYISQLNGTAFTKISPEYQQVIETEWMDWFQRYYFQTIEDVNKDGKFTKEDKYHFFYIDFNVEPYKVVEYFPLEAIETK